MLNFRDAEGSTNKYITDFGEIRENSQKEPPAVEELNGTKRMWKNVHGFVLLCYFCSIIRSSSIIMIFLFLQCFLCWTNV